MKIFNCYKYCKSEVGIRCYESIESGEFNLIGRVRESIFYKVMMKLFFRKNSG